MNYVRALATKRSASLLAVFLCVSLPTLDLFAGPAGSLYPGFTLAQGQQNRTDTISVQSDGKIIVGGTFTKLDGAARTFVGRLNSDGTLDPAFVPPGIESYNTLTDKGVTHTDPKFVPVVFATAIQSDGKILVGGSFYFVNSIPGYGGLIRLNSDGSVDSTFAALRFSGSVDALAVLPDGKILVGGDFGAVGDVEHNALVRLESTGALDKTFNVGAVAGVLYSRPNSGVVPYPTVATIAVEPSGNIVVGGSFTSIGGTSRRGVARFTPDGTLDSGFVPDPAFNPVSTALGTDVSVDEVLSLVVQADGKIVVGGDFNQPADPTAPANSLYRFNGDGSLDQTFNPGRAGTLFSESSVQVVTTIYAVALDSGGRILIGGAFAGYNGLYVGGYARVLPNGKRDQSFVSGFGSNGTVFSLGFTASGALLVGGEFGQTDSVLRSMVAEINTVPGVPPTVLVRIAATKKTAHEATTLSAQFTVSRTGSNQTADLVVPYAVSGSAVAGKDYEALPGSVTIPAGSSSATILVTPEAVSPEGDKKVTLTLVDTPAFGITQGVASVRIIEP